VALVAYRLFAGRTSRKRRWEPWPGGEKLVVERAYSPKCRSPQLEFVTNTAHQRVGGREMTAPFLGFLLAQESTVFFATEIDTQRTRHLECTCNFVDTHPEMLFSEGSW
jgi:hypothetical protein